MKTSINANRSAERKQAGNRRGSAEKQLEVKRSATFHLVVIKSTFATSIYRKEDMANDDETLFTTKADS